MLKKRKNCQTFVIKNAGNQSHFQENMKENEIKPF